MKTSIVYTLVSDYNDFYYEQAVLSACSVKIHSPKSRIVLVVDERTDRFLNECRALILKFIDEKIVVDLSNEQSNVFRSRILKTTLRRYIKGPFLFIDTDTIVCRPLYDIDDYINMSIDIAAVPDAHCRYKDMTRYIVHKRRSEKLGWNLENDEYHFNSGVMFVNDTDFTHEFYEKWHSNWLLEKEKDLYFDQLALAYTNGEYNYPIRILSGEWNCQIEHDGVYYFAEAYILHLLGGYHDGHVYYFKNLEPYRYIKEHGAIDSTTLSSLNNPKSAFVGKANFIGNEDGPFFDSSLYTLFTYHRAEFNNLTRIIDKYLRLRNFFKSFKKI